MSTCAAVNSNIGFLRRLISIFMKKEERVHEPNAAEVVTGEIDDLWNIVRTKNEGENTYSVLECREKIAESFRKVRESFSDEQLDSAYAWPRYVKVSVYCSNEPIKELVEYLNAGNYIPLTKRLSDLSKSVFKGEDEDAKTNVDYFSEAVYHHIIDYIKSADIPSLLFLGRLAQKRGAYDEARNWFTRITETEEPFNGITAILSCYEEETKGILSTSGNNFKSNYHLRDQVKRLNESQCAIYEKWCGAMEEQINGIESVSEQYKREYVSLVTGYARFERNRGNYEKAFELLERIPSEYPDMYRVYTEEAMLYQFRPYKNRFYSLEKAIETFQKAYASVEGETGRAACAKSKKSILMPLANTYFQSGRYKEASDVCERVLKIDGKEHRAISLKNRIACIA